MSDALIGIWYHSVTGMSVEISDVHCKTTCAEYAEYNGVVSHTFILPYLI